MRPELCRSERSVLGRSVFVVMAVGCLLLSACGNRASYEAQLAAQQGAVGDAASNGVTPGRVVDDPASTSTTTPGAAPANGADSELPAVTVDGQAPAGGGSAPGAPPGDEQAASPPAEGSAGPSCPGQLSTIKIGTVGHQTGLAGASLRAGPMAVQAWVAAINARGGVACHPVEYIIADDGGDPAKHQSLVRQLVEREGVIAFVQMNATLSGHASVDYLTKNRIPVIGTEGASPWVYDSPMYFPQGGSGDALIGGAYYAVAQVGKPKGATRLAVVACTDASICARGGELASDYAKRAGLNLVYKGSASLLQPDYTSQCLNARDAKADILLLYFEANGLKRFGRSCASVGYKPIFGTTGSAATAAHLDDPNLRGMVVGVNQGLWFGSGSPGTAEYLEVLANYAPGVERSPASITGWAAAKLFEAAAQNLPEDPTSEDVLEGLWSINGNDFGGLTPPLTFTRDKPPPVSTCYWIAQVGDGEWTSPNGGKRTCP